MTPKDDAAFSPEQYVEFRDDPIAARQRRWFVWRRVEGAITYSNKASLAAAEEAGLKNIEAVDDPAVREKLRPQVPYGSHRPLSSNLYYPMFNRANVELVTEDIARITADAIVTADGATRPVDTIILATGYDTGKFCSSIDITGRGGLALSDAWAKGAQAYLGVTTAGFPNLFMLYGPNTNNGSIIYMIECQVDYIVRHLQRLERESLTWMDVKPRRHGELQRRNSSRLQQRRGLAGHPRQLLPGIIRHHRHAVASQHDRVPAPHVAQ